VYPGIRFNLIGEAAKPGATYDCDLGALELSRQVSAKEIRRDAGAAINALLWCIVHDFRLNERGSEEDGFQHAMSVSQQGLALFCTKVSLFCTKPCTVLTGDVLYLIGSLVATSLIALQSSH